MADEFHPDLSRLNDLVGEFISERDWGQYHRPKDVAAALAIEAAELQELYLWDRSPEREELEDELGDIFFFLLDMGMRENIDIIDALKKKLEKNEIKYPAHLVKGSDAKYTKYQMDDREG
ncbi:MAG: nucleotide pyrophosphohydrolase [Thermoplasmatota archaeon]